MTAPDIRGVEWARIRSGTRINVVKVAPEGHEVTRYPGLVIAHRDDGWVVVQATWTYRPVELDGLQFRPGDVLLEWFSPVAPYNAFAVHAPEGELRGWYANVTYPTRLDPDEDPPLLTWHDLYIDLVGLPDGSVTVRDEDELRDSKLEQGDPTLHSEIIAARDELLRRFAARIAPFVPLDPKLPNESA